MARAAQIRMGRRASEEGVGLPAHVRAEFERYLDCGVLAQGFARVRCSGCGHAFLLAFSCKGRGLCPSCGARRMVETAATLVDEVLPKAPYRQWVLTVPFRLRLLLARRPDAVTAVLGLFLRQVGNLLRRKARAMGVTGGQGGSVTFVQRFGDALNLHVHFHAVLPHGVFTSGREGLSVFHQVPPPTDEEVLDVCRRTQEAVLRWMDRAGLLNLEEEAPDGLAQLQAHALQASLGFVRDFPVSAPRPKRLCAAVEGFPLHANVHLHPHDREGLERLLRYGARPNFSLARLGRLPDGRVTYQLKRPLPNGVQTLLLPPLTFLARLCAMVPPPRAHLVRYHGVFAPNAKARPSVVTQAPGPKPNATQHTPQPGPRLDWAPLLKRVYPVDVLQCPRCNGRLKVLCVLTHPPVLKRLLAHLNLPSQPAPRASPRFHPEQLPLLVSSVEGPPASSFLAA